MYNFTKWEGRLPVAVSRGIQDYVNHRITPSDFLRACLENDLYGAISHAAPDSLDALPDIMNCFWYALPAKCWGSKEAVKNWLQGKDGAQ